jgi:hypothetical protein
MTDERFAHEDTAADRWTGAMLEVRRRDGAVRVDELVDRSVERLRTRAPRRPFASAWRTPLAAAASIAVIAGAALLFAPQPASASALLRAAQVAESGAGDRRYRIELAFPRRGPGGDAPRAEGTLDVRGAAHVRLDLAMPDGRRLLRGLDGATSWTVSPSGEVLRVPADAPWPRFIETPEGELLVDRLDSLLGDVGAFYAIDRCDAGGAMRLCARRVDPSFRGPERIELTLDPVTKAVLRAELSMGDAPRPRTDGARDEPAGDGRRPDGPPGAPRRPAPPSTIVVTRTEVPGGAFAEGWFAPPSEPTRDAPPPPDDRQRPPHRERDRGDRPPPPGAMPPFGPPPRD